MEVTTLALALWSWRRRRSLAGFNRQRRNGARAVATSLCVIALISVPATASHLLAGQPIPLDIATLFAIGAVLGLKLGSRLAAKLSGPRLQQLFGATMLVIATLILLHNLKSI